ncbi:MAG: Spy/CpxP family protein refolding chaperone [Gemmatimonadaceae bacterium]
MQRLFVLVLLAATAGTADGQRLRNRESQTPARDRAQMEQQFRERYAQLLKQRLGLTDAQLVQVAEINRRFDAPRRELFGQERELRMSMREALRGSEDAAVQARVSQLLEQTFRVQRSRLDLLESEQKELSSVLTPVQRAKFLGMQEQLRRRVEEMRSRREGEAGRDPFGLDSQPPTPRGQRKRPGPG